MDLFFRLGIALAVGLLVGVERGWQSRLAAEGSRVAGVRTFGLIGLLGGLWALLAEALGEILLGIAFAGVALLIIVAHAVGARDEHDYGITTAIAALVTFALGALAVRGYQSIAAAGAVVTAVLLSLKPTLHSWLQHLEPKEFFGALKLLLISVVMLPVLPNQGYGPWQALNPYEIWWLVVLIAGISFVGYFAMKIAGAGRGTLLTGLLGGLVSSTAVTLSFSRLGRDQAALRRVLSVGILVASGTMFPRILVEVAVVNTALLSALAVPLGLMTVTTLLITAWFWRRWRAEARAAELPLRNPFELAPALQFGVLLAAIILLAQAFQTWFGSTGLYLVAGFSGLADVDAVTLSLATMARVELPREVAANGIVLATVVNTLTKGVLAMAIGGVGMGRRVLPPLVLTLAVGVAALFLV
jgi:uncharacterized membrane protein (DUF4010 family)